MAWSSAHKTFQWQLPMATAVALLVTSASPVLAFANADVADLPSDTYVSDRLIIRFKSDVDREEKNQVHDELNAELVKRLGSEDSDVVDISNIAGLAQTEAAYEKNPNVLFAEPDLKLSINSVSTPNDPFFPGNSSATADLWSLNNTGQNGGVNDADIDAPEGWALLGAAATTGSPWAGVSDSTVGVIDSGYLPSHQDLQDSVLDECYTATSGNGTLTSGCTDDNGHGTHVTGIIAAQPNNGVGIDGVAPGVNVFMCKAINAAGSGVTSDVAACINKIVENRDTYNIRVISMSLGGSVYSSTLEAAVDHAYDNGILVVASAGNDGTSTLNYPAALDNVVSVAATDRSDKHASYSQTNSDVEISAPGSTILSTVPAGYATASGTSMAAPHAAAVAALIYAKYGLTGSELRDRLDNSVDDLGAAGRDSTFGYGRINLCLALGGSCSYGGSTSSAPTADFTPSASLIEADSPLTVDASSSTDSDGTITSYQWDFDEDGQTDASGLTAQVNYLFTGDRKITLTVEDNSGNTSSVTKDVTVVEEGALDPQTNLTLNVALKKRQKLKRSLAKGFSVTCTIDQTGICSVNVKIKAALAKKLGLKVKKKAKYVTIASGYSDVDTEGTAVSVKVKFKSNVKKQLKRSKGFSALLTVTGEADAGSTAKTTKTLSFR